MNLENTFEGLLPVFKKNRIGGGITGVLLLVKEIQITLGKVGIPPIQARQKSGIMTYFMKMGILFQKRRLDL